MKIEQPGTVTKVYLDPADNWCIVVKHVRRDVKYIRFKDKPKVKVGDKVYPGDNI